jgi:glycosyltransferase involved in cell wall biosynthesis
LRLAVVSPFIDRRHGTERAFAELLQRLAREHHCEIHLYAQRVEDMALNDPRTQPPSKAGAIFWHKVPSIPGPYLVRFLGWMLLNEFLRGWHRFAGRVSYDLVLSPGINCLHSDVVIVHALFHRLRELARDAKDDDGTKSTVPRRLHRRAYYWLLTALERRIYMDPNVSVAAVSRRTANLLEGFFHRKDVPIILNAVDTLEFSPTARLTRRAGARQRFGFHDGDFVLLLIGNDWRTKGLPTLLRAIASLLNLPTQLLVVGQEAPSSFHAQALRLGVQQRCHWEVPRPNVLEFYAAADVYVSPSREDSFGLPVAEAMACGLPVITSLFAGIADSIEHGVTGFILQDPFDDQQLAKLLQQLWSDSELRRLVGESAARATLQWTWDLSAADLLQLLEEVLKKKMRTESTGIY